MKFALTVLLFLWLHFFCTDRVFCQNNKIVDFARDVAPLLHDKCFSCHHGDEAKNGFQIDDRASVLGFVEPGDSANSSLWQDYLTQPSREKLTDSLVMPPDGPLDVSQLALLKLWIDEGADWPEGVSFSSNKESAAAIANGPISFGTKLFRAIGYFHPAMVHFPIALFLVGATCAFLSYFLGPKCQTTAFQCIALAAAASIITAVMGWSFAETQGYPAWNKALEANASHRESNFYFHRWLGTLVPVLGVACVLLGLVARRNKSDRLNHAWRIGAIGLGGLVALVGHQGGELVYGDVIDKAIQQLSK